MKNEDIVLRSPEVEEVFNFMPGWLTRFGNLGVFLFLSLLTGMCWVVRYPDYVPCTSSIRSLNEPKEIRARIDGKLSKLLVRDREEVKKDAVLGILETNANQEQVTKLLEYLNAVERRLVANDEGFLTASLDILYFSQLGELQSSFQTFMQSYHLFLKSVNNGAYLQKRSSIMNDLVNLKSLSNILQQQKQIRQVEDSLDYNTLKANKTLLKEKVIAPLEYDREESQYLAKKLELHDIESSIITNNSAQSAKLRELAELDDMIAQQKKNFIEAFGTFKNQVLDWQKKYLLVSPVDGVVSMNTLIKENNYVGYNQLLMYVVPPNNNYYALLFIQQNNLGKVLVGNRVNLRLPSYPYEEFGQLEGHISSISHVPIDSGYLARVELSTDLITTQNKRIVFKEGLSASANIVTKDLNLLQRFYYNALKLKDR